MTMSMKCGECHSRFKFQEKHAGKTVKCPACGKPIRIPALDTPAENEETTRKSPVEDEWSWSDTEDDSPWNSQSGEADGFQDEEESRPLPPRSGQKRKTATVSGGSEASSPGARAKQIPAGVRNGAVFVGGAVISLSLTLVIGLMFAGGVEATAKPADATRAEVNVAPKDTQTAESKAVSVESPVQVSSETPSEPIALVAPEKNAGTFLQVPVLSYPVYPMYPGLIGDTGIVMAFSSEKWVGFKPSFFDGDDKAVIGPIDLPNIRVTERLTRRFDGKTILLVTELSGRIHELNPETFEIMRSATLFEWPPKENAGQRTDPSRPPVPPNLRLISSFEETDPYVYASINGSYTGDVPSMWAVDLRTFEVLNRPDVPVRILGYAETRLGNAPLALQAIGHHQSWLDPHERFLVQSNSVIDLVKSPLSVAQIQQIISGSTSLERDKLPAPQPLDVQPLGVIDRGRWIVGVSAEKAPQRHEAGEAKANPVWLCFISPDSFETVVRAELPNHVETPLPSAAQQATGSTAPNAGQTTWQASDGSLRDVMAFDDPVRKRLILSCRKSAVAIPYELARIPKRPLLAIQNRRTECIVGEPLSFDLKPLEEQTEVTIIDAPKGLVVNGSVLGWKPTQNDIGNHPIRLQLKKDGFQRELIATISVSNPAMPWRGSNRGSLAISRDGRRAIAVMEPEPGKSGGNFTVFDLKERRVIAEKFIPGQFYSIDIGSKHFIALRDAIQGTSGRETLIGSAETLEIQHAVPTNLSRIQLINDRYVYPGPVPKNQMEHFGMGWIDLEDKKPQWPTSSQARNGDGEAVIQRGFQCPSGVMHAGIFRRAADNKPGLLAGVTEVFSVRGFQPRLDRSFSGSLMNPDMAYRPGITRDPVINNVLFSPSLLASDVCQRAQVRLQVVQHEPDPDRKEVEDTLSLVAVSLKTREVIRRWMVLRQPASAYRNSTGSALSVHGDTAWVVVGGRLQEISLAELPDEAPSIHVDFSEVPMQLDTEKTANEFNYRVRGTREPLTTQLQFLDFGRQVSQSIVTPGSKAGEFKVDGTVLLNAILEHRSDRIHRNFMTYTANEVPWIQTYKERASGFLKAELDYTAKNVPLATTVYFSVTDADGNTEELIHQVLIEVPEAELDKLLRSNINEYGSLHKK